MTALFYGIGILTYTMLNIMIYICLFWRNESPLNLHSPFLLFCSMIYNELQTKKENKMNDKVIRFEDIPEAMSLVINKLESMEEKLDSLQVTVNKPSSSETWLTLQELQEYLPSHPARQTIYGWTSCHQIPYHKRGKRIMFLKSEIDVWLHEGKYKSRQELMNEASQYVQAKRKRSF